MFNRVTILGNLVKEVELKITQGNVNVCANTIATNHKTRASNGQVKEEVCFIDIVVFGKMAENMKAYLRKGSKVFVEGRLVQDSWTDKDGKNRQSYKVVVETMKFLDAKPIEQNTQSNSQSENKVEDKQKADDNANFNAVSDEEINEASFPF